MDNKNSILKVSGFKLIEFSSETIETKKKLKQLKQRIEHEHILV
tara:strand:+ start:95084 stop:95215 length:132 start_codon:yes stop_codon:yes gene_type:complete